MTDGPRICDYGNSTYREDFWEGQGRDYEDVVERQVLAQLLPARGHRLLEIGAGFGRISLEYSMYDQVVLLDYSLEQLIYARKQMGDDRFIYVAADAYKMPFCGGAFDGATMIRVIHHFEDVSAALAQVSACLTSGGKFILEYANKRHLKSILRYLLGRNKWSPHTLDPIEFVELNFNFHPDYMLAQVASLGFDVLHEVPVSWLRLGLLKKTLPTSVLSGIDSLMQRTGWRVSPSISSWIYNWAAHRTTSPKWIRAIHWHSLNVRNLQRRCSAKATSWSVKAASAGALSMGYTIFATRSHERSRPLD